MTDDGIFADYDAADPVAENNARRDVARQQREDADTVRRLLSHRNGRAWFHRLLARCHIYGTPFSPGEPDTTNFRLGEENVGKVLMYEALAACPEQYLAMIAEARKEDERVAAVRADEEKKRQGEDEAAVRTQGFDLAPPAGWSGHVPPVRPEGK
jgi:hypothetical protein